MRVLFLSFLVLPVLPWAALADDYSHCIKYFNTPNLADINRSGELFTLNRQGKIDISKMPDHVFHFENNGTHIFAVPG